MALLNKVFNGSKFVALFAWTLTPATTVQNPEQQLKPSVFTPSQSTLKADQRFMQYALAGVYPCVYVPTPSQLYRPAQASPIESCCAFRGWRAYQSLPITATAAGPC